MRLSCGAVTAGDSSSASSLTDDADGLGDELAASPGVEQPVSATAPTRESGERDEEATAPVAADLVGRFDGTTLRARA